MILFSFLSTEVQIYSSVISVQDILHIDVVDMIIKNVQLYVSLTLIKEKDVHTMFDPRLF